MNNIQEMIDDMNTQSSLYKPTTFWIEASKIIQDELKQKDIQNFRNFDSSMSMFVPSYAFPKYLKNPDTFSPLKNVLKNSTDDVKSHLKLNMTIDGEAYAFSDYRVLSSSNINKSPYLDKVSESNIGNPLEQFTFNNRVFSRSFLNYLLGLSFLKQHVDTTKIATVFEIGGGYGTLGEILLSDNRNEIFYINADIPPIAHISSYYLQTLFKKDNVASYYDLKDKKTLEIETLKEEYSAINISSWQIPKLQGKIDLFVNFISFQEMEPEVVKNYCKHIARLSPQYILLRNIKEGKRKQDKEFLYGVKEPIKGHHYDEFFPEYKLLATDDTIFGLKMEDGFHSQLRLYVKKQNNKDSHEY